PERECLKERECPYTIRRRSSSESGGSRCAGEVVAPAVASPAALTTHSRAEGALATASPGRRGSRERLTLSIPVQAPGLRWRRSSPTPPPALPIARASMKFRAPVSPPAPAPLAQPSPRPGSLPAIRSGAGAAGGAAVAVRRGRGSL